MAAPRSAAAPIRKARGRLRDDRGSAIAEFALVVGLVLAVSLAVMQLSAALFVRNTLQSAASEGARLGARANAGDSDGVARTQELIRRSLSDAYAGDVTAVRTRTADGLPVLQVTVTAPIPVFGLLGISRTQTVTSRALIEGQL